MTCPMYDRYYLARIGSDNPAPTRTTLIERFGGWTLAVHALGLTPGVANPNRRYERMSPDEMLGALARVAGVIGSLPSVADYDRYRKSNPGERMPCSALIRRRFTGWPGALAAMIDARREV